MGDERRSHEARDCVVCGKAIDHKRGDAVTCGDRCRKVWSRMNQGNRAIEEYGCARYVYQRGWIRGANRWLVIEGGARNAIQSA